MLMSAQNDVACRHDVGSENAKAGSTKPLLADYANALRFKGANPLSGHAARASAPRLVALPSA
jgi:hypothetical protein